MSAPLPASRLRARDAVTLAVTSLAARRLRTALTAGGVAIGLAAMVAVLGVSRSSRADVLATLDELGTDLLAVRAGETYTGTETALPDGAPASARRIAAVEEAAAIARLDVVVRRTDRIPIAQTSGIQVAATEPSLLAALQADLAAGRFLGIVPADLPAVVLGVSAAERLGIDDLAGQPIVWLGDQWFAVVGILAPVPLAPELDSSALVGWTAATRLLVTDAADVHPTTIYVRTRPAALDDVRELLPRTVNPESPEAVRTSRPSDALAARAAADEALTALMLGLGAVALLVGGIGIANVMVIAVLERRGEIGLRRSLGATRRHIRIQFLLEAVALSGIGGTIGVGLGATISATFAARRDVPYALPIGWLGIALTLALLVGAAAGLYPAARAARLQPADAIRPR